MSKQLTQEQKVLTSLHPPWIDTVVEQRHFDDDMLRIFLFYVFYSPCSKCSAQGRALQYYNWKEKPWSPNRYLKDKLDDGVFFDKKKYFSCVSQLSELPGALHNADLDNDFYNNIKIERVAFYKNKDSEYISLFYHIRCALAHGRVAMFETPDSSDLVFVMENGMNSGKAYQVKARMVLRKSTLLKWADIITNGPREDEDNVTGKKRKAKINA